MNVKIGCNKLSGAPVKSRYRLRVPVKFTGIPAGIVRKIKNYC